MDDGASHGFSWLRVGLGFRSGRVDLEGRFSRTVLDEVVDDARVVTVLLPVCHVDRRQVGCGASAKVTSDTQPPEAICLAPVAIAPRNHNSHRPLGQRRHSHLPPPWAPGSFDATASAALSASTGKPRQRNRPCTETVHAAGRLVPRLRLIAGARWYEMAVRRSGKMVVVASALVVLWAGFAYTVSRPTRPDGYRRVVVQVAETAHDAARTGWLAGRQELAGQVVAPFAATAFDDATRAAAGASKQFAEEAPPDEESRRLRDELGPLVLGVVVRLADAAQAADDAGLRSAVDDLGSLAERLQEYVERLR
jgi:hypothetical protein